MGLISKMKEKFYGALSALESRDMELHRVRVLAEDISHTEVYQKGPLVIKVWGAKSQKTLWGLWKGEGPSD